ncbi:MAG: hypothetical protein PHE70_09510, partial [Tepidanaerobacteraceae bacterium]|nr:hypothetical protein [Tepidanaerobacteraceae bacterium]
QDDLLIKLFDEVSYVWPKVGYPPLVTPFSQYVKNLALMNVLQLEKGRERWSMIADNIWDMILGNSGKLPGEPAPEIIKMAKEQNREFYSGTPQELYPDKLDEFRAEMKKNNWELGKDDEELFELAMHPEQYRDYKSGVAKKSFEEDLDKKKAEKDTPAAPIAAVPANSNSFQPKSMVVNVDNESFVVNISYPDVEGGDEAIQKGQSLAGKPAAVTPPSGQLKEVLSPLEGKFYFTKESSENALKVGDTIKEGDLIGYIESMKTYNAVSAEEAGIVREICFANGESVDEDDILIKVE